MGGKVYKKFTYKKIGNWMLYVIELIIQQSENEKAKKMYSLNFV